MTDGLQLCETGTDKGPGSRHKVPYRPYVQDLLGCNECDSSCVSEPGRCRTGGGEVVKTLETIGLVDDGVQNSKCELNFSFSSFFQDKASLISQLI